jgi:hypothetical protein
MGADVPPEEHEARELQHLTCRRICELEPTDKVDFKFLSQELGTDIQSKEIGSFLHLFE